MWLEVGSVEAALPRPTHQRVTRAVGRKQREKGEDVAMAYVALLHLILGPWASGKSTLVKRLAELLPEHVVFDWDLIIPGLSLTADRDVFTDPSTWKGLHVTWFAIISAVLRGGHDVVLCCWVEPGEIPSDVIDQEHIRVAFLDCPDDVLRARLSARGESVENIHDEIAEAAKLRHSPYFRLDGTRDPDALAKDAAAWVLSAKLSQPRYTS